jgi:glycerol uptake facilitator-like aquaporin
MIRRIFAEALGTCLLIVAVVGSGIMATNLTDDIALQLLCNAVATGGALVALIVIFAPISGASFNPAVGIVSALLGESSWRETAWFALAQVFGGCIGAVIANVMFDLDAFEISTKARSGSNIWISEGIATFGLLLVIWGTIRANRRSLVPLTVAAWITGAYFFTSSTSLANPAVSIARALSNSFAGIKPQHVPMFIVMQLIGAGCAFLVIRWLFKEEGSDVASH